MFCGDSNSNTAFMRVRYVGNVIFGGDFNFTCCAGVVRTALGAGVGDVTVFGDVCLFVVVEVVAGVSTGFEVCVAAVVTGTCLSSLGTMLFVDNSNISSDDTVFSSVDGDSVLAISVSSSVVTTGLLVVD